MVEIRDVFLFGLVIIILFGVSQVFEENLLLSNTDNEEETFSTSLTSETATDDPTTSTTNQTSSSEDLASQAVGGLPIPYFWITATLLGITLFYRKFKMQI